MEKHQLPHKKAAETAKKAVSAPPEQPSLLEPAKKAGSVGKAPAAHKNAAETAKKAASTPRKKPSSAVLSRPQVPRAAKKRKTTQPTG